MAFEVIVDPEKDVAALIDPELGRALGPIALGKEGAGILEEFAGSHGVDPATIPGGELEARWKAFVSALTEPVGDVDGETVTAGDVVAAGHPTAGAAEQAPVDPTAGAEQAPAEAPAATVSAVGSAEVGATPGGAPPAAAEVTKPVTAAKPGFAVCPTCDGWGEVVENGITKPCPTCGGTGEVAIEQHPGTPAPGA